MLLFLAAAFSFLLAVFEFMPVMLALWVAFAFIVLAAFAFAVLPVDAIFVVLEFVVVVVVVEVAVFVVAVLAFSELEQPAANTARASEAEQTRSLRIKIILLLTT
jgi:hypothetical protein